MHLYNAWLPPPVAEETIKEKESFASILNLVRISYRSDDPDSVYSTLKFVSVLELFVRAKSDVSLKDVEALVEIGLEVLHMSQNKFYVQVRWGNILVRYLKKYGRKLSLKVQWRPLYDTLMRTHFKRNIGPEGWRLRQRHFVAITSLVNSCRKFFPAGSASEIWSEFRLSMQNPWHNSCFEGAGFIKLFLPTNMENCDFFTHDWVKGCLDLWDSIPNCQFWDIQWAGVLARSIKDYNSVDWECFLPVLFTRYLNMFEVPTANSSTSFPFSIDVPRNTRFLFSSKGVTPAKSIAKSIVYLLRPGSSAQKYFENVGNFLEQYYHPSNGGRWTYTLERFLRYLVIYFQKRLQHEQKTAADDRQVELSLGSSERAAFVKVVLKLIDRGQYSKNESLAETVAIATSVLAYVEPSLVLPFVASRFHLALETMTATHQLKSAVTSVAYAGRALFFASVSSTPYVMDDHGSTVAVSDVLLISLTNALLGMDANDPPKTTATMQLIGSIFSNLASLDDDGDGPVFLANMSFSGWLDEFLCRLFSLLVHLEPSSVLNEGVHTSGASGTFLVEDGPYYFCMLEILLGKLSKPLFNQALKKISKFIDTNILPGAVAEVGLLCCACVHSNPDDAAVQLIEPLLKSIISSLNGTPISGFGGKGFSEGSFLSKATLSPALEMAIYFKLKVLSVAISYAGPWILPYRVQLKEAISSAFEAPSWKVNGAGDHVLRSLLGSLVLYYPVDQYKCFSHHPAALMLEDWISSKDYQHKEPLLSPKWHIPSNDELLFANELLDLHLRSALDDLLRICQNKVHSDLGNEKEHLKVTLLRIDSSLQGVLSCLPDFHPSFKNGTSAQDYISFAIAGASGSTVGNSELRERAAEVIFVVSRYIVEERSDDSILLKLIIRIMDALVNFGSLEFDEWSNHRQAWKVESATLIEPPINFIVSSHSQGKKRPRWALIDKAYLHSMWRSSQSSYHLSRLNGNLSPSEHVVHLMEMLLTLSLHSYETVRSLAGKSLLKILKRWPFLIGKCVHKLTESLRDPNTPEHAVLGSCTILAAQTVLRHLSMDMKAFSSFVMGVLSSSHHETLKSQRAISELFVKFNIHFAGISRNILRPSTDSQTETPRFEDLVSLIVSMGFETTGLHWRYNLMANRILLLVTMALRNDSDPSSKILVETAGHFLKNLKSQLPQTRMLAISALNILLQESSHRLQVDKNNKSNEDFEGRTMSSLEDALSKVFLEDGFFNESLNSLSHVHIVGDTETTYSRGHHGASSLQSPADKSITLFYFDFSSSWPRTPSWISLLSGDTFYSSFARIFKRLAQECGMLVLVALQKSLEEFSDAKERPKQCVAAEVLAGVLHSDINGLLEAWNGWIMGQLQKIILAPSVDSIPEWAACIRYAVTGKGKHGRRSPLLRQKILNCLAKPLPQLVATNVVAKRYVFLSAALIEIYPSEMSDVEVQFHAKLLQELLDNMGHSSAQVREAVGVTLSVVCSNMRLLASSSLRHTHEGMVHDVSDSSERGRWEQYVVQRALEFAANIQKNNQSANMESTSDQTFGNGISSDETKEDIKWLETMLHFIISSLKSGRSSHLLDIIVGLLYPIISLQETSNKDLSTLAKAAFELLKWMIIPQIHLKKAVSALLLSANDSNWRTRSASLAYLRSFMYRHTFLLSSMEKKQIWKSIESLLVDNQVEIREHAAGVLAGLLKGGDDDIANDFRDKAFAEARHMQNKQKRRELPSSQLVSSVHGAVLALASSVLSVPYDLPSWLPEHVTLLARFIGEPSPIRSTVTKAIAEFRRTHADTWNIQKDSFTEDQLEVLTDTSSSSSYFA